jgi:hypothetical protein
MGSHTILRSLVSHTLLVIVILLAGVTRSVEATTVSWTGAVNGLWSNGGNWVGGVAPVAGDDLVFPGGASNLNNTNDLPAGTIFRSIAVTGGAYQIGGNLVGLTNGITVPFPASATFNTPFKLFATQPFSSATYNGAIDLNGFNLTINGGTFVNGVISGSGNVRTTTNAVYLNGDNTYTGLTTVDIDTAINGTQPQSDVVNNVFLFGSGSIGNLTDNGTVAPGPNNPRVTSDNGPGILSAKNVAFSPNQEGVRFDLAGAAPGTGYDQLKITGTVQIGANATALIVLNGMFTATGGQQFVLIDNDGTDPIVGTFNSFDEGATFARGLYLFHVTYRGGDGNDFTLTVVNPSTTVISSSQNPSSRGNVVTFTAVVSGPGGTPTGMVTFIDGGATDLAAVPLIGGVATFSTGTLNAGTHVITASYPGDADFVTSVSAPISQLVMAPVPMLDARALIALALALSVIAGAALKK